MSGTNLNGKYMRKANAIGSNGKRCYIDPFYRLMFKVNNQNKIKNTRNKQRTPDTIG